MQIGTDKTWTGKGWGLAASKTRKEGNEEKAGEW